MAKKAITNDWWNKTIGNSLKYSAIGSLISVGLGVADFFVNLFGNKNQGDKGNNITYKNSTGKVLQMIELI